jgi:DnaJ-class molecular chaperone
MKDYYQILGVVSSASDDEIKAAFRDRIRQHHPDKNSSPEATERAREVIEAYKILFDREARARYDKVFHSESRPKASSQTENHASHSSDAKSSTTHDPILEQWIRAAQRQAKAELKNLINDLPDAAREAAKGAFQYVVHYIVLSLILYLLVWVFIG